MTDSAAMQNYNYSGNVGVVTVNQNSSYGLGSLVFKPQAVGQSVNVFSGKLPVPFNHSFWSTEA